MLRRIIWAALLLWCVATSVCVAAVLTPEEEEVERIKGDGRYYYGFGSGASEREADQEALKALSQAIHMSVSSNVTTHESDFGLSISQKTGISSFTTLQNTQQILLSEEPDARVFRYILRSDVEKGVAERARKISDWLKMGLSLEKKVEVGPALQYYNWSYALATVHPSGIPVMVEGKEVDAKTWLNDHINRLMKGISIELDNVEERADPLNPYVMNLKVTYQGEPVADMTFDYHNTSTMQRNYHVRNGAASLDFPALPAEKVDLRIVYKYEEEGRQFDPELRAIYDSQSAKSFKQAAHTIKCKGVTPGNFALEQTAATETPDVALAPKRKLVQTEMVEEGPAQPYIEAMQQVARAIESRDYKSVAPFFTEDGYDLFMLMQRSGDMSLAKTGAPELTVEQSGNYLEGRALPVVIKYKRHSVNEELVFRFNNDGRISSVAYALSRRAQDDIFRQNMWGLDARYAIKQFMEDYQTAFALKRLGFISGLFSDDALIITGKRAPSKRMGARKSDMGYQTTGQRANRFVYTAYNKEDYLAKLQRDFTVKSFIKLTFEENEISASSGVYENIYWIQLRQHYESSNYNDVGYLALMIDMRGDEPKIKIRTWNPEKFDLSDLKRRFPVN